MNLLFLVPTLLLSLFINNSSPGHQNLSYQGAWQNGNDAGETICMMDGYFSYVKFDGKNKIFYQTWGGPYATEGNNLKIKIEFDSKEKTRVGKEVLLTVKHSGNLLIEGLGETKTMKQVDEGKGELAGCWRITARKQGETMNEMPLRARRTLKLLTGTRFQWMAINIETGEFSGTGGGTYTFKNGKYTENIEFFSRDSSRVGASLSFDGKVENGNWHHSGLSSRGEPIYEIWSRHRE
ncbi:MAG TPA: hypothetical protein VFX58_19150 [Chitinophagaceae bacterium]|nr:hypothetical protein [Chitinophagaceae bacterium]